MRKLTTILSLAVVSLTLMSCGGGGGGTNGGGSGSHNTGTPGQAQSVYEGSTSDGSSFDGIILPNDKFYAIYGTTSGNVFFVCGLATGQGTSNNGAYTATENDFDYCGGGLEVLSGNVSATYTPGSSLNGSLTESGVSESFTGTAPSNSLFNYNAPASLTQISGSWNGSLTDGESASVTIASSGSASGFSSDGCAFTATITPDSSSKNFFDVSLTFGGSPCELANQSATGIAVDYLLSDGVTTQLIAAVSSGSAFGIVFAAERVAVPPPPVTIAATAGTSQSTTVSTAFASPLVATVTQGGLPVSGASVTFTAPASGPGGTFANGTRTETDTTNTSGTATSTRFTANAVSGTFTTTATTAGASTAANFTLTNNAPASPVIVATSGTPQSTTVETSFATELVATVTQNGSPVSGASVTFTAPTSGASGTFSNGTNTETRTTNLSGVATSTAFTANASAGSYIVTATVSGASTPADFSLTNNAAILANGTYVFSTGGSEQNHQPYFVAGSFTVAAGTITGGEEDYKTCCTSQTDLINPTGSSVTKTADGNLKITLVTCDGGSCTGTDPNIGIAGVETFNASMISAARGRIVEFDTSAASSGTLDLQTSVAAPSGSYAFAVQGFSSGQSPLAMGGIISISGNSISTSGSIFDMSSAGTAFADQSFSSGSITIPGSPGRVVFTLTPSTPTIPAFSFAGYIVDARHIQLVELQDQLGGTLGGTALGQNSANLAVSGNTYVLGLRGYDSIGGLQLAGAFTAGSGGDITGTISYNDLGNAVQTAGNITGGTYIADSSVPGRVTITALTDGSTNNPNTFNIELYLDGNGDALAITLDSVDAMEGVGYQQTSGGSFTGASFGGIYTSSFTGADRTNEFETDMVGSMTADGVGTFSGFVDASAVVSATANLPFAGTFTASPSGVFPATISGLDLTTGTNQDAYTYYLVDTNRVVAIEVDSNQLMLGSFELQQ